MICAVRQLCAQKKKPPWGRYCPCVSCSRTEKFFRAILFILVPISRCYSSVLEAGKLRSCLQSSKNKDMPGVTSCTKALEGRFASITKRRATCTTFVVEYHVPVRVSTRPRTKTDIEERRDLSFRDCRLLPLDRPTTTNICDPIHSRKQKKFSDNAGPASPTHPVNYLRLWSNDSRTFRLIRSCSSGYLSGSDRCLSRFSSGSLLPSHRRGGKLFSRRSAWVGFRETRSLVLLSCESCDPREDILVVDEVAVVVALRISCSLYPFSTAARRRRSRLAWAQR